MKKFSLPKVLLTLNLLAVLLLILFVQVKSYKFDVVSRNNALFNAEKSYVSGCLEHAQDKNDEMTKWSCKLFGQAYRRDMQAAVGLEPIEDNPFYDKLIDKLAL